MKSLVLKIEKKKNMVLKKKNGKNKRDMMDQRPPLVAAPMALPMVVV